MPQKPPVWARVNRDDVAVRGLISYLPLNEGGGLWAHDPVNGLYHRSDLINGPIWDKGADGPCLKFDGTDDYVKTTRNDFGFLPTFAAPHTYVAWVNPTLTGSTKQSVISVGEFNDNNWSSLMAIEPSTGELFWLVDPAGTGQASGLITVANKWQFIAVVRTATEVYFYLNGTRAVFTYNSSGVMGSDPIIIGGAARNSGLGSYYFSGKISAPMVYNRALTDSEVRRLFVDPYALFIKDAQVAFLPAAGGTTYNESVSESVTASDAQSAAVTFVSSLTEAVTAAASQTSVVTFTLSVTESVTAADSQSSIATFVSSLTEGVSAGDSTTSVATFNSAITEGVTAADSQIGGLLFVASLTESVSAACSQSATVTFTFSVTEAVSAGDSQTSVATFNSAITESVSAADSQTSVATFNSAITEAVSASDSQIGGSIFTAALTEAVNASDSVSAQVTFSLSITEGVSAACSQACSLTFNASVTEALSASDLYIASLIMVASVVESVSATDFCIAVGNTNYVCHVIIDKYGQATTDRGINVAVRSVKMDAIVQTPSSIEVKIIK